MLLHCVSIMSQVKAPNPPSHSMQAFQIVHNQAYGPCCGTNDSRILLVVAVKCQRCRQLTHIWSTDFLNNKVLKWNYKAKPLVNYNPF